MQQLVNPTDPHPTVMAPVPLMSLTVRPTLTYVLGLPKLMSLCFVPVPYYRKRRRHRQKFPPVITAQPRQVAAIHQEPILPAVSPDVIPHQPFPVVSPPWSAEIVSPPPGFAEVTPPAEDTCPIAEYLATHPTPVKRPPSPMPRPRPLPRTLTLVAKQPPLTQSSSCQTEPTPATQSVSTQTLIRPQPLVRTLKLSPSSSHTLTASTQTPTSQVNSIQNPATPPRKFPGPMIRTIRYGGPLIRHAPLASLCHFCTVVLDEAEIEEHKQSEEHQSNVARTKSWYHECASCQIVCSGVESFLCHIKTKSHRCRSDQATSWS